MAVRLQDVIQERLDADSDFHALPPTTVSEIVKAILWHTQTDLCKTGWQASWISLTEAFAADQTTLFDMNLLRSGICLSKTIPDERIFIELSQLRDKRCEEISDKAKNNRDAEPEPNWPVPCHHCKQKKVFHFSVQTRSADEASTLFFKCLNCGKEWKGS